MTNEKDVARCVLCHQRLQSLHDETVGEDGVAHLVFAHRKIMVEQIGRLALRIRDRLFPAAIFEVARDGHDHDVELLRQILRPTRTILEVDEEFVKIRRAAIHDDEPRIAFRLRIEALQTQSGDVPIKVVATKVFNDPISFVAQLLRRKFRHIAWIEGAARGLLCQPVDRSSAVRQVETRTEPPKLGLPQRGIGGLGIVEEDPDLLFGGLGLCQGGAV